MTERPTFVRTATAAVLLLLAGARADYDGKATTYGPPDGGNAGTGNCGLMAVMDFAPQFHIGLNDEQYNAGANCGRCVWVWCWDDRCQQNGHTYPVMGQITDRCPECQHGDLDISAPMFREVTGDSTDRYDISWEFADCPAQGGIQVCAKSGSSKDWLYVQPANTVGGVASMKINGGEAPIFPWSYYFMSTVLHQVDLDNTEVEMTSDSGETISTTVALVADQCTEIPHQFQNIASQSRAAISRAAARNNNAKAANLSVLVSTTPAPSAKPIAATQDTPQSTPPSMTTAPTTTSQSTQATTTAPPSTTLPLESTLPPPTTAAPQPSQLVTTSSPIATSPPQLSAAVTKTPSPALRSQAPLTTSPPAQAAPTKTTPTALPQTSHPSSPPTTTETVTGSASINLASSASTTEQSTSSSLVIGGIAVIAVGVAMYVGLAQRLRKRTEEDRLTTTSPRTPTLIPMRRKEIAIL
ncbi:Aste57867_20536 [Aphanomyces stellatus]|uniref:Aste57867_20536 protein n=1 Tax=Aphanomyces stellatus TaxID=120398 RepID=A0A485LGM7_9STRA|nr:hypothetical protein As57867_020469 [Aphanomyces stellatus]VFT97221.1 Aste57867_20536 [Aphanomyces stellatus]